MWGQDNSGGGPVPVVVDRSLGSGWQRVGGRVRADRYGIFRRGVWPTPARATGYERGCQTDRRISVPFSLTRPAELLVNPFGGPYQTVP